MRSAGTNIPLTSSTSKATKRRRMALLTASLLVSTALVELLLNVASAAFPQVRWALLPPWKRMAHVADPMMKFKGNPDHPEHDRLGFRNATVPDPIDIVAIGDSQTYGTGVTPEEAWPQQLGVATGRSTYNLSVGGWGPVQYLANAQQGIELKPRLLVVGLNLANDIFDAYAVTYRMETGISLRSSERLSAIMELDDKQPLWLQSAAPAGEDERNARPTSRLRQVKSLLSNHSKLYALVRSYRYLATGGYEVGYSQWTVESRDDYWLRLRQLAAASPDQMIAFESDGLRTILTPRYRMTAVDVRDLRIAEGVEVTRRALRAMQRLCLDNGAKLLVLVFPTKELAFSPFLTVSELNPDVARHSREANRLEDEVRRRIFEFLVADKIDFVDALPVIQGAISEKRGNPFFESRNGHFSPFGHRAIGRAVASHYPSHNQDLAEPPANLR